MVNDKTVCIKAVRVGGGLIAWNYDSPKQCAVFWENLCSTMRAPDTGDELASAAYFRSGETTPHRIWERFKINVGDTVTWRRGRNRPSKGYPIGIAGCKVVEFGQTAAGQPAAFLKLPKVVEGVAFLERLDHNRVPALVADLEV